MKNKEILQADLLDILFENRNKAYGAYALRKYYNHRLQWALGVSLSLTFFLLMINVSGTKNSTDPLDKEKVLQLSSVVLPEDKPKKQDLSKTIEPPQAQAKYTSQIKIVDDYLKTDMPEQDLIDKSLISTETKDGAPPSETVQIEANTNGDNGHDAKNEKMEQESRIFSHSDAQFPGGREAFAEFLKRYLNTPADLEVGEKKVVVVRFMVDVDGVISNTEIMQSGGDKYDKEVIRVLRKMPKWIPALQNGIKVATYFVQPVTFMGVED
jgi:protein TonB